MSKTNQPTGAAQTKFIRVRGGSTDLAQEPGRSRTSTSQTEFSSRIERETGPLIYTKRHKHKHKKTQYEGLVLRAYHRTRGFE